MSQFKNNPDFNLYYSDTDSAYIDKPLPDHLVHSKDLGKMKLENTLAKAIFCFYFFGLIFMCKSFHKI